VALAACEFPTEPPKWEQTWKVPGESITVSVAELLPAGVALTADSSAFVTDAPGTTLSLSLTELCGSACEAAHGFSVPKPEFQDTLRTTSALPGDLVSATLSGGSLNATLAHTFSFDPLRPSQDPANPRGYLVVRVTSSGNVVAFDSIHGDDTGFPSGTTLSPGLTVNPVAVADSLDIEVAIYSPQGDNATIDTTSTLTVDVATSTLEISEATVNASAITIDPVTTVMDFGGVDSTLVERIQSGALLFDIANPFTVTGTLDVSFQGPSFTPIQRTLSIAQGTYADSIAFSGDELRSILGGEAVDVVASGNVAAAGGTVTVTPTQRLVLDNEFQLVILIGPTEDL
jgi:hypothetical protein